MNICKRQTFIGKKYQTFNKKVSKDTCSCILRYLAMYPKILCYVASCAHEACFIGQRSLFHHGMKPTSCTSPENTYESPDFRSVQDGRR